MEMEMEMEMEHRHEHSDSGVSKTCASFSSVGADNFTAKATTATRTATATATVVDPVSCQPTVISQEDGQRQQEHCYEKDTKNDKDDDNENDHDITMRVALVDTDANDKSSYKNHNKNNKNSDIDVDNRNDKKKTFPQPSSISIETTTQASSPLTRTPTEITSTRVAVTPTPTTMTMTMTMTTTTNTNTTVEDRPQLPAAENKRKTVDKAGSTIKSPPQPPSKRIKMENDSGVTAAAGDVSKKSNVDLVINDKKNNVSTVATKHDTHNIDDDETALKEDSTEQGTVVEAVAKIEPPQTTIPEEVKMVESNSSDSSAPPAPQTSPQQPSSPPPPPSVRRSPRKKSRAADVQSSLQPKCDDHDSTPSKQQRNQSTEEVVTPLRRSPRRRKSAFTPPNEDRTPMAENSDNSGALSALPNKNDSPTDKANPKRLFANDGNADDHPPRTPLKSLLRRPSVSSIKKTYQQQTTTRNNDELYGDSSKTSEKFGLRTIEQLNARMSELFPNLPLPTLTRLPCVAARIFGCYLIFKSENEKAATGTNMDLTPTSIDSYETTLPDQIRTFFQTLAELELVVLSNGHESAKGNATIEGTKGKYTKKNQPRKVHFSAFDGAAMERPSDVLEGSHQAQVDCIELLTTIQKCIHELRLQESTCHEHHHLREVVNFLHTEMSFDDSTDNGRNFPHLCAISLSQDSRLSYPTQRVIKASKVYAQDFEKIISFRKKKNDDDGDDNDETKETTTAVAAAVEPTQWEFRLADASAQLVRYWLRTILNPVPERAPIDVLSDEWNSRVSKIIRLNGSAGGGGRGSLCNVSADDGTLAALVSEATSHIYSYFGPNVDLWQYKWDIPSKFCQSERCKRGTDVILKKKQNNSSSMKPNHTRRRRRRRRRRKKLSNQGQKQQEQGQGQQNNENDNNNINDDHEHENEHDDKTDHPHKNINDDDNNDDDDDDDDIQQWTKEDWNILIQHVHVATGYLAATRAAKFLQQLLTIIVNNPQSTFLQSWKINIQTSAARLLLVHDEINYDDDDDNGVDDDDNKGHTSSSGIGNSHYTYTTSLLQDSDKHLLLLGVVSPEELIHHLNGILQHTQRIKECQKSLREFGQRFHLSNASNGNTKGKGSKGNLVTSIKGRRKRGINNNHDKKIQQRQKRQPDDDDDEIEIDDDEIDNEEEEEEAGSFEQLQYVWQQTYVNQVCFPSVRSKPQPKKKIL